MTKSEQVFLGLCALALAAIFVFHYQRPGTGLVVANDPNSTGIGDINNGPAYLTGNAPWLGQAWNGGAVIPMATTGTQNMNSDVVAMASNAGGCGCS